MFPPVLALGFIEAVIALIVIGFTIANWVRKIKQAIDKAKPKRDARAMLGKEKEAESATDLEAMAARRREQLRLASGGSKASPPPRTQSAVVSAPQRAQREAEQRRVEKMRGTEGMAAAERQRAEQARQAAEAARARSKQADRVERAARARENQARREQAKAEMATSVAGLESHAPPAPETPAQTQRGAKAPAAAVAATSAPSGRTAAPGLAVLRGMSLRDAIVVREILDPPLSIRPAQRRQ